MFCRITKKYMYWAIFYIYFIYVIINCSILIIKMSFNYIQLLRCIFYVIFFKYVNSYDFTSRVC